MWPIIRECDSNIRTNCCCVRDSYFGVFCHDLLHGMSRNFNNVMSLYRYKLYQTSECVITVAKCSVMAYLPVCHVNLGKQLHCEIDINIRKSCCHVWVIPLTLLVYSLQKNVRNASFCLNSLQCVLGYFIVISCSVNTNMLTISQAAYPKA